MKTIQTHITLSLLSLAFAAGCSNADTPAPVPNPGVSSPASETLSVERVLADVDTGREPEATRAKLEALLADRSLSKEDRAPAILALAKMLEGTDRERSLALLEEATALGDQTAEKRLFAALAGHEAPSWNRREYDTPVADSARALAKYFPAATPDRKVEIDILAFGGQDERESNNRGTFAIGDALRENAVEACGLCDEVRTSIHTHASRERYWSAIPRYSDRLERAVVVLYVTEETLPPERYAKWLAAPVAELRAALERGQGLVAVRERVGAPPLVTLAAPRTAQFATVETAFAAMTELPKSPVTIKLPTNLSVPEVQSGIRARFGAFKACYTSLLKRRPTATGKTEVAYTITGAGKLTDVVASFEGSLDEAEYRACFDKAMATVRYPSWSKAADAKITVRYPIIFSP